MASNELFDALAETRREAVHALRRLRDAIPRDRAAWSRAYAQGAAIDVGSVGAVEIDAWATAWEVT